MVKWSHMSVCYLLMLCCVQKLTGGVYCRQCTLLVYSCYQSAANSSVWYTYICTYSCWNLSVCLTFMVVDDSAFSFLSFHLSPFSLPPVLSLLPSLTGQRLCYGNIVSTNPEIKGQIQTTHTSKYVSLGELYLEQQPAAIKNCYQ